jgi:hypothetical protein
MKSLTIISSSLLLIFFQTIDLKAQWSPSFGLEGTHAGDITLHNDSLLFITTPNGIYKRNLSSFDWEMIDITGYHSSILSNGTYLYSFGPMCNFVRSDNNGETWEEIEEIHTPYSLDISGSVIIACKGGAGTFRSEDNGDNWTQLGQYPAYELCNIFICDSMVLFNDIDLDTLWISDDLGITFEGLTLKGLSSSRISDFYIEAGELLLGHYDGIFHYNVYESKWTIFGDTLPANTNVGKLFKYNDSLRFISNKGYFSFNTSDSSWISNNYGLEDLNVYSVDFNDSVIFAGTKKGPFYKENNKPWKSDYYGLHQRIVNQVVQSDSMLFALTEDGLFYSVDNGGYFDLYPTLNYPYGNEMIITDSAYYLATSEGFAVSMDEGYSWTYYNDGLPNSKIIQTMAISDSYIYAGLTAGLFRSSLDTIEWFEVFDKYCYQVVARDSIIIMSVNEGNETLYRSTDYGLSFSTVSLPGIGVPIDVYHLNETNGKVFVLAENPYFTKDWGITWSFYPLEGSFFWLECIEEDDNVTLLGGLNPIYPQWLLMSDDQGNTWNDISGGLPSEQSYPSIGQCIILNNRIIAYPSGNSLWYRDDLITTIPENNKSELTDLDIFPNPFDDMVNIRLADPDSLLSQIMIYDVTGKLVYQEIPRLQMNKMEIDTSGFPSGIYILTVQCPGEVYSTKLIKY